MTSAEASRFRPLVIIAFFVIITVAAVRPLGDVDYFWHLATGRWIHEHGALPRTDPFGAGTDPVPWINGEWLFQYLIYPLHAAFGVNGIVIVRVLFIGALFTALLLWCERKTKSLALSLGLCTIAWFGAIWALSERPASFAVLFVVLAIGLALREPSLPTIVIYVLLTIVWINFHPSALLAPVIAAIGLIGRIGLIGLIGRPTTSYRSYLSYSSCMVAASAIALLVNPYGIEGILAPQRLVHWVTTGPFKNIEWQPASPATHPFLFAMIALALLVFAADKERRQHIPHLLLIVLFGAMAIRFLRNHGMFYSVWPMLIAPMFPPLANVRLQRIVGAAVFAFLLIFLATHTPSLGINEQILPVRAAARLAALHPPGNIFCASHLGGYLIWTFYPERRVVNDGRNELHHAFLTEYAAARRNSRDWRQLLDRYRITTAVADYEPPMRLKDARSGQTVAIPASRVFFPRSQWALIAFDDAAMVFARRAAWQNRDLGAIEIRGVDPERQAE
jgi:hypothetical protein